MDHGGASLCPKPTPNHPAPSAQAHQPAGAHFSLVTPFTADTDTWGEHSVQGHTAGGPLQEGVQASPCLGAVGKAHGGHRDPGQEAVPKGHSQVLPADCWARPLHTVPVTPGVPAQSSCPLTGGRRFPRPKVKLRGHLSGESFVLLWNRPSPHLPGPSLLGSWPLMSPSERPTCVPSPARSLSITRSACPPCAGCPSGLERSSTDRARAGDSTH